MSSTAAETTANRQGGRRESVVHPDAPAWVPYSRYSPLDPDYQHFDAQLPRDARFFLRESLLPRAPDSHGPPLLPSPRQPTFPPRYQGAAVPISTPYISYPPPPCGPPPLPHQNPAIPTSQQSHSKLHLTRDLPSVVPTTTNGQQAPPTATIEPPVSTSSSLAISPPKNKSNPMRITDILSGDGVSNSTTTMGTISIRSSSGINTNYRLRVRQQPVAARSCGPGERDRRVIDPPPIVQLLMESSYLSEDEIRRHIRYCHYVMSCSIYDESGTRDATFISNEYRPHQRQLMGSLVSASFVGKDEFGDEGCFFCFPDLSCRRPGQFRLKFSLVMIDPVRARDLKHFPVLAEIKSEVFDVCCAKDFPGMQASSELTKRLQKQGCIIPIKKGVGGGGVSSGSGNAEDQGGPSS